MSQPDNYRFVFALDFLDKCQCLHRSIDRGLSWVSGSDTSDWLLVRFMLSRATTVKVCGLNHINKHFKGQIPAGVCA